MYFDWGGGGGGRWWPTCISERMRLGSVKFEKGVPFHYGFRGKFQPPYRKTSNISHTLVGNRIVDNSDVIEASPVGAAPTTSSFST